MRARVDQGSKAGQRSAGLSKAYGSAISCNFHADISIFFAPQGTFDAFESCDPLEQGLELDDVAGMDGCLRFSLCNFVTRDTAWF